MIHLSVRSIIIGFVFLFYLLANCSPTTANQNGKIMAFFQNSCNKPHQNPCQQICQDIGSGGFYCACRRGHTINPDGMTCTKTAVEDNTLDNSGLDNVNIKSYDFNAGVVKASGSNRVDSSYNLQKDGSSISREQQLRTNRLELEIAGLSCVGVVCEYGGRCIEMGGVAVCRCPFGRAGEKCEEEMLIRHPRFFGSGYISLPTLRNSHEEFTISMLFKPDTDQGLILYSGEVRDASTDFFSLFLQQGRLVFQFDCGTGPAELWTKNIINLSEWNTCEVWRRGNSGGIRLNGQVETVGSSEGEFSRITFRLPLYVGGSPDISAVSSRVGTTHSFSGCVERLTINGHRYDFRVKGDNRTTDPSGLGESESGINVSECSDGICDSVLCENGGSCISTSASRHVCLCPVGFHGDNCEKSSPVLIPQFGGHSFLQHAGLQHSVLAFTEIDLVFKPTSHDGVVVYNGFSGRKGDFLSIAMSEGHLEFRYDLGTGPAILRSSGPLALNKWHRIQASRTGLAGFLEIEGQKSVSGESQGAYTQLSLPEPLYIGGHPNFDLTAAASNLTSGFTGCIQRLTINRRNIRLLDDLEFGVNVSSCTHPCTGSPCMNGGECQTEAGRYVCMCPRGYRGDRCEAKATQVTVPMFSGHSYLRYTNSIIADRASGGKMDLSLSLRAKSMDGLVFWSGEDLSENRNGDFMSLGFREGSLQLRFNLGSGETVIAFNDSRLFDGQFHIVHVQRLNADAYLEIDEREVVEGTSPGKYTSLNTDRKVYLGGMPDIYDVTGGHFSQGFHGCIRDVTLGTDFDLDIMEDADKGRNILDCDWRQ